MTMMTRMDSREDEIPLEGEEEPEQGASSAPLYDPLLDSWQGPPFSAPIEGEQASPLSFDEPWLPREPQAVGGWRVASPGGRAERPVEAVGAPYPGTAELREVRGRVQPVAVPRPRSRWATTVRELAETLLLALLIFLAVRASFQNFRVEGASMMPSLENGEYLIVNKLAYARIDLSMFDWLPWFDAGEDSVHHLWAAPQRGDVIVFRSPTNVNRDFIKRIIGVPGDTVEIDPQKNQVLLNGVPIEEPYVRGKTTCGRSCGPWTVPEGHYFVMGDNRQNSSDSRQGWFVPEENIIGKALFTYWKDGQLELGLAPNHSVKFLSGAAAAGE